jgi:hypothetical protein
MHRVCTGTWLAGIPGALLATTLQLDAQAARWVLVAVVTSLKHSLHKQAHTTAQRALVRPGVWSHHGLWPSVAHLEQQCRLAPARSYECVVRSRMHKGPKVRTGAAPPSHPFRSPSRSRGWSHDRHRCQAGSPCQRSRTCAAQQPQPQQDRQRLAPALVPTSATITVTKPTRLQTGACTVPPLWDKACMHGSVSGREMHLTTLRPHHALVRELGLAGLQALVQ